MSESSETAEQPEHRQEEDNGDEVAVNPNIVTHLITETPKRITAIIHTKNPREVLEFNDISKIEVEMLGQALSTMKSQLGMTGQPEMYSLLMNFLRDYKPSLGKNAYEKTKSYVQSLTQVKCPDVGKYFSGCLKPPESVGSSTNTLHSLQIAPAPDTPVCYNDPIEIIPLRTATTPGTFAEANSFIVNHLGPNGSTQGGKGQITIATFTGGTAPTSKEVSIQYYKYCKPDVDAYIAVSGVPTKIVLPQSSATVVSTTAGETVNSNMTVTSVSQAERKVTVITNQGTMSGAKVIQIRPAPTAPIRMSQIASLRGAQSIIRGRPAGPSLMPPRTIQLRTTAALRAGHSATNTVLATPRPLMSTQVQKPAGTLTTGIAKQLVTGLAYGDKAFPYTQQLVVNKDGHKLNYVLNVVRTPVQEPGKDTAPSVVVSSSLLSSGLSHIKALEQFVNSSGYVEVKCGASDTPKLQIIKPGCSLLQPGTTGGASKAGNTMYQTQVVVKTLVPSSTSAVHRSDKGLVGGAPNPQAVSTRQETAAQGQAGVSACAQTVDTSGSIPCMMFLPQRASDTPSSAGNQLALAGMSQYSQAQLDWIIQNAVRGYDAGNGLPVVSSSLTLPEVRSIASVAVVSSAANDKPKDNWINPGVQRATRKITFEQPKPCRGGKKGKVPEKTASTGPNIAAPAMFTAAPRPTHRVARPIPIIPVPQATFYPVQFVHGLNFPSPPGGGMVGYLPGQQAYSSLVSQQVPGDDSTITWQMPHSLFTTPLDGPRPHIPGPPFNEAAGKQSPLTIGSPFLDPSGKRERMWPQRQYSSDSDEEKHVERPLDLSLSHQDSPPRFERPSYMDRLFRKAPTPNYEDPWGVRAVTNASRRTGRRRNKGNAEHTEDKLLMNTMKEIQKTKNEVTSGKSCRVLNRKRKAGDNSTDENKLSDCKAKQFATSKDVDSQLHVVSSRNGKRALNNNIGPNKKIKLETVESLVDNGAQLVPEKPSTPVRKPAKRKRSTKGQKCKPQKPVESSPIGEMVSVKIEIEEEECGVIVDVENELGPLTLEHETEEDLEVCTIDQIAQKRVKRNLTECFQSPNDKECSSPANVVGEIVCVDTVGGQNVQQKRANTVILTRRMAKQKQLERSTTE